jgi:hypothetical protein
MSGQWHAQEELLVTVPAVSKQDPCEQGGQLIAAA